MSLKTRSVERKGVRQRSRCPHFTYLLFDLSLALGKRKQCA
jgi:hypothetical protein